MGCRHCNTEEDETQEHQEVCPGLAHEQWGLNINKEQVKLIFWWRMAPKIKEVTNKDNLKEWKKKIELKKAKKKTAKTATNVTKAATTKTLSDKLKTETRE